MRAVLDPNVVISGLISPEGTPARLLAMWRQGRFEMVVSPLLLDELRRALAYPKLRRHVTREDAELAVRWLADGARSVEDEDVDAPLRSPDPGDDYIIALAAHARAALVSGDAHLLGLQGRLPVYTPRELLELVERQGRRGGSRR